MNESLDAPRAVSCFADLELSAPLLRALAEVGYESPSPLQAATIPVLLSGVDLLGQAETGTGKTAAYALPALTRIELARHEPQVLVLVSSRGRVLAVAEAFQCYAAHLPGFHVLPVYDGQSHQPQLNALRRGAHVVIGTPARVIDHVNRGSLELETLDLLVLDEVDELARQDGLETVQAILREAPPERQLALFAARLPAPVRRFARHHLRSPVELILRGRTVSASRVPQRHGLIAGTQKLDALTRLLESEPFDALLVLTRTRRSAAELAERLEARGFAAAALHGDLIEGEREYTLERLHAGQIDVLVATDLAARGLEVPRIGHILYYDAPLDPEVYLQRLSTLDRARRITEVILFVTPRERDLLRSIERATRATIPPLRAPRPHAVHAHRAERLKTRLSASIARGAGRPLRPILESLQAETGLPLIDIAAALASLTSPAPRRPRG